MHPGLIGVRVPCERGARDVRLQLAATATLVGRIVTDSGAPLEKVQLVARLESDGPTPEQQSALAAQTYATGFARPDGSFAVPGLFAGRWTLSARLSDRTRRDPLRVVEGIELRAGEACTDPRLDPLDLRGIAHRVRIQVVAPAAGASLRGRGVWREAGQPSAEIGVGHGIDARESFELLLLGAPVDVSLAYEGYRPVRLDAVAEDRTAELKPGLAVLLRLPAGLRLPEPPSRLVAQVSYLDAWGKAQSPSTRLPFDGRGELRARAGGPGPTLVRIAIESTPGRSVGSELVGPNWREVQLAESADEQVVDLDVTQAEIDAALAKIAAR